MAFLIFVEKDVCEFVLAFPACADGRALNWGLTSASP
jgi:hypothetical protein